jgi:8-oxo-dGTP pyrophosphatase MutT (NUDIX family)
MIVNMGVENPETIPVRDAATVMLVRDGDAGLEVFMLRRNLRSDFVGGAYVFPGGAVDSADAADDVAPFCAPLTDVEASRILDIDQGGLAFWVAAVRESFEEAGLLLASAADGSPIRFDSIEVADVYARHRELVDTGQRRLVDVCAEEALTLNVSDMHYFSRWITPLGAPRRYDTRFFVAHPPEGQVPAHDNREVIENLWIRPQDALDRFAAGEFELIFPTARSLEALARFDVAEDVVNYAANLAAVEAVLPTIVESDHGLRIVLPGDEVYDAITARRIT